MDDNKNRGPKSKVGRVLLALVITLIVGAGYYYVSLPALNLQDSRFYVFIFLLCLVFIVVTLFTSGIHMDYGSGFKEYFHFVRNQCLPVGILLIALVIIGVVGTVISLPIFRAGSYRDLLNVETGDFAAEVDEISYDQIPMLDEDSAQRLGDRKLGELSDMVSQFEVTDDYTQINYKGRPVRVTPLKYGDLIKWFNNRANGLPAYIIVDMVTQEAEVVRLDDGMKYSPSEPFNRNVMRHLRFCYPTYMFSTPNFEVDDSGHPYWVCPKLKKTIGLFGGTDIDGAVLMDAVTGECVYYQDVPNWVDRVYSADLITEQYNYHGKLAHGFLNSVFGQKDVTTTTEGYNYIALNDDVYMYTGVTSIGNDQSNVGFLLSNQRTKETKYYQCAGATEYSAMDSAKGVVQHLNYSATFPLLLNISGEPTYFMALKDNAQLVKMYAMVNVAQYQIVATGTSVATCEQEYVKLLAQNNITVPDVLPETAVTGTVAEVRSAVLDGNSYYFIRLDGEDVFYSISAASNPIVVVVNPGDTVSVDHAPQSDETNPAAILDGYSITVDGKNSDSPITTSATSTESQPSMEEGTQSNGDADKILASAISPTA
ncbi:MAG: CvpA family protein [Intestinimonas sp.]|jgi:hypothetical protein|nr:CvpA family protein [Intestinimonas sp.]